MESRNHQDGGRREDVFLSYDNNLGLKGISYQSCTKNACFHGKPQHAYWMSYYQGKLENQIITIDKQLRFLM
jgi:hypothetical protein